MSTESPVQKDERNPSAEQDAFRPMPDKTETRTDAPAEQPLQSAQPEETFRQDSTDTPPASSPAEGSSSNLSGGENTASEPGETAASEPTEGIASRCFGGLATFGPVTLFVLWLVQSLPTFLGRELHALHDLTSALTGMAAGLPSPDLYPVYHWFLGGLGHIPGAAAFSLAQWIPGAHPTAGLEQITGYPVALLPIASALSTLFLIILTWGLSRATGNDRRTSFAAGLVMLVGLNFMGMPRISGGDMLFASILTLSGICLYRGWIKDSAPFWLFSGFVLISLSTLAGGLLGLAFPLFTSLIFLLWRGTFRRAGARDGALAFGLMLVLLLTWCALLAFSDGGRGLLKVLIEDEYVSPIREAWAIRGHDAWISPALLAIIWLPWTLLLLFLPWKRLGSFIKAFIGNRTLRPGQGWLWCSVLVPLGILGLLGANMTVLLLPVFPPLAVLTAQALRALPKSNSRGFFMLIALLCILLGLLFGLAGIYPSIFGKTPIQLAIVQAAALPLVPFLIQTIGLVLAGLLLWKATNRSFAEGALLVLTLLTLLYTTPLAYQLHKASAAPTKQTTEQAPPAAKPAAPAVVESPAAQGSPEQQVAPAPAKEEAKTPAPETTQQPASAN